MNYIESNSNEMKTVVETFVIEETSELIYDNEKLDRWNEIVKNLNLEGQTKIVSPEKSPIPFMFMKQTLINIFETLCPRKVDVTKFDVAPIPVEILDLVALSVREKYFNKIEIWYDDKSPDPLCVGQTGYFYQPTWYSQSKKEFNDLKFNSEKEAIEAGVNKDCISFCVDKKYLIGKWGDVKMSFKELKEMAIERYISDQKNEYESEIAKYKRKLEDLNLDAHKRFN
jgi:hypothetical protein